MLTTAGGLKSGHRAYNIALDQKNAFSERRVCYRQPIPGRENICGANSLAYHCADWHGPRV